MNIQLGQTSGLHVSTLCTNPKLLERELTVYRLREDEDSGRVNEEGQRHRKPSFIALYVQIPFS